MKITSIELFNYIKTGPIEHGRLRPQNISSRPWPKGKFRLGVGKTKNIASTTTTNSFPCQ